jgi:hypothetical protein
MTALMAIALVAFVSLVQLPGPPVRLAGEPAWSSTSPSRWRSSFPVPWRGVCGAPPACRGVVGKLIRVQSAIHDYAGQTRAIVIRRLSRSASTSRQVLYCRFVACLRGRPPADLLVMYR